MGPYEAAVEDEPYYVEGDPGIAVLISSRTTAGEGGRARILDIPDNPWIRVTVAYTADRDVEVYHDGIEPDVRINADM